ncbi:MAG: hypothetical protein AAB690_01385 [Patescibacteria group bacterium]
MKYEEIPLVSDPPVISLRLERYDDIFSDFDIRPYPSRALSVDFLDEIKRASQDKEDVGVELMLHMPEKERNESRETTIKERLTAHFKKHHLLLQEERKRILKFGIGMVVMGIFCMVAATFIIFKDPSDNILLSFLVIFLEPAAWFLLWEGMDQIIFNSKNVNPELSFYRKMSHAKSHAHFKSY